MCDGVKADCEFCADWESRPRWFDPSVEETPSGLEDVPESPGYAFQGANQAVAAYGLSRCKECGMLWSVLYTGEKDTNYICDWEKEGHDLGAVEPRTDPYFPWPDE